MQDQNVIREFLVESHENLSRLDQEIVELEKHPKDAVLLGSIFRTFHTIKGTCGFLSANPPEKVDDVVRNMLGELVNMIGGNLKCVMARGLRLSIFCCLRICGAEVLERLAVRCFEGPFWVTVLTTRT
jgi:hypothetical protein